MAYLLFASSAFVSAFLLFAIEPAIGKMLLPAYGGSILVWGTCMIGFQALLFVGYLLAHHLLRRVPLRLYGWIHVGLLLLAFGLVWARPPALATAAGTQPAILEILLFLFTNIGFPFILLSFSTPLLQRGLVTSGLPEALHPYRLFSASNLGSCVALLAYPFLIEPTLDLRQQTRCWSWGLLLLAVLIALAHRLGGQELGSPVSVKQPANSRQRCAVFLLSAGGSALLLAATNILTTETASVPLLWVIPLSLYLLSFVLAFRVKLAWLDRVIGWCMGLALVLFLLTERQLSISPALFLFVHLVTLFFGCLWAHGQLARLQPADQAEATGFYATISAGGLVGSIVVVVLAPLIASHFIEYPLALLLITAGAWAVRGSWTAVLRLVLPAMGLIVLGQVLVVLVAALANLAPGPSFGILAGVVLVACLVRRDQPAWQFGVIFGLWLSLLAVDAWLGQGREQRWRSYYGTYRVAEGDGQRRLNHGTTTHGAQFLDPAQRGIPLTYYHPTGPAGEVFSLPADKPRHIGMIGLGTGALLAYGKAGEQFHVLELDPLNVRLAEEKFTYLRDARERGVAITIVTGDGRLNLRPIADGTFDLFVIDAFSGDAIPIHLLTVEALRECERVTKPDGVVLVHISNRLLRLEPIVAANLLAMQRVPYGRDHMGVAEQGSMSSVWAFYGRDAAKLARLSEQFGWTVLGSDPAKLPRPWTDQYSNLLPVISGLTGPPQ